MATLQVHDPCSISADDLSFCEALWATRWTDPPYGAQDPAYRSVPVFYVIARLAGEMIGACCVLHREVRVNGLPRAVAGLSDVLIKEQYRLRGIGSEMVRAAMAESRRRGYGWGMLFCLTQRPYYERLGWHALQGHITVTQFGHEAPTKTGDHVMVAPLTAEAEVELATWITARVQIGVGQW